jgi:hypothetical protein
MKVFGISQLVRRSDSDCLDRKVSRAKLKTDRKRAMNQWPLREEG